MNYEDARVCLFDPARHNLMVTRASLVEIGFTNIDMITDFAKFSEAVSTHDFNLIIAETHDAGGAVGDLMRKIRIGEVGDNPFVVTISTSWGRETEHLQNLVDCGIDDILLRPFSTSQIKNRLKILIANRKDFVVTSDYVGPDRRNDSERQKGSITPFAPPNTLKAVTEGSPISEQAIAEEILATKTKVTKERIRKLAMKIVISMQVKIDDPIVGEALDMEEIDAVARELRRRLRGHGAPDAVELAGALTEITTDLLDPEEQNEKQFKLVRELALGAFTAFAGGEDVGADSTEVQNTINALRTKLQQQMISGFHSAQA
ncbi:MAG: hypothetical protein COA47_10865 [Robiginitomaculum sp.]|nr:MAG: hypothetical protein COA47_10865 [Robiginitomaculum sp.]